MSDISQSDLTIAAKAYAQWSQDTRSPNLTRRTAERHATMLLPHLKPGMRLLDCGCGPGSITLGLARAVSPAETIGLDISADAIAAAQNLAREQEVETTHFQIGDVCALPFEDGAFDAAFSHALLQHLRDPAAAVREMHRALKPGGVIVISDFDYGGGLIWPSEPLLERAIDLMGKLHEADGRSPYVGRELAGLLCAAGFTGVKPRAAAALDGAALSPGAHLFWMRYFEAAPVRDYIVALGLATEEDVRAMPGALQRWGEAPGGVWTRWSWDALGWKAP